jgi:hypothetical protein
MNQGATNAVSVGDIVSNGINNGLKNFVPLLLTGILYVITVWIPYLNLGTTIGLFDIIAKIARGEKISPSDIFDPKYRQRIGDFFLLLAILGAGYLAGNLIPGAGIVIGMAWMLALPMFVDKGVNPMDALTESNRLTYGNKLNVFLGFFVLGIIIGVGLLILSLIGGLIDATLGAILVFLAMLVALPIELGAFAYVYGALTKSAGGGGSAAPSMG